MRAGKDAFHSVPDLSLSRFRKWDAAESVLTAAVTDRSLDSRLITKNLMGLTTELDSTAS